MPIVPQALGIHHSAPSLSRDQNHTHNMAPRLPPSKLHFIHDMIQSQSLTTSQMADAAGCSERTIKNIRRNLRLFGTVHAPPNRIGRRRSITQTMLEALCDHLLEKPGLYLDEMAIFLWGEFQMLATASSIRRALVSKGWSRKTTQQKAKEQNAELRELYLHNLSDFESYHLVYVDESGCDKRVGFRRTGWSPLGIAPKQVSQFHRDERYQILPAYAPDSIIISLSSFTAQGMAQIYTDVGVKLVYLPLYSPELNPMKVFLAELKSFIRRY